MARDVRFNSDAVTGLEVLDGGVHSEYLRGSRGQLVVNFAGTWWRGSYLAGRFMAKDVFVFDNHRTNTAGMPEVDIGAIIGATDQNRNRKKNSVYNQQTETRKLTRKYRCSGSE